MTPLTAVSPIDGRYHNKVKDLGDYFSESALIKYRILVEVKYFQALYAADLPQLKSISAEKVASLSESRRNPSGAHTSR